MKIPLPFIVATIQRPLHLCLILIKGQNEFVIGL
jgi:hypothetical protein